MLTYRTARKLRVRKFARPEAPLWPATMLFLYAGPSHAPIAVDITELTADSVERAEVEVADEVADILSREQIQAPFRDPVVVEAAGPVESVFRKGEDAARHQLEQGSRVTQIISSDGAVPRIASSNFQLVISAWPFDFKSLEPMFREASDAGLARWGVWLPVIYPVTTELEKLERLADLIATHGGSFLASSSIDATQTAKSAIARAVDDEMDDEMYDTLFHADPETLALATERHAAALAHERGLEDGVPLPGGDDQSNWSAAILLASAGSRLARMKGDPELGWTLLRSSVAIANLGKPLSVVASAAPLSIIEGLDPLAAGALEAWLRGEPAAFLDEVNAEWRLRRDAGWSE